MVVDGYTELMVVDGIRDLLLFMEVEIAVVYGNGG